MDQFHRLIPSILICFAPAALSPDGIPPGQSPQLFRSGAPDFLLVQQQGGQPARRAPRLNLGEQLAAQLLRLLAAHGVSLLRWDIIRLF